MKRPKKEIHRRYTLAFKLQAFDVAPFSNEAPSTGLNIIYKGIPAAQFEASERKLFQSELQR